MQKRNLNFLEKANIDVDNLAKQEELSVSHHSPPPQSSLIDFEIIIFYPSTLVTDTLVVLSEFEISHQNDH